MTPSDWNQQFHCNCGCWNMPQNSNFCTLTNFMMVLRWYIINFTTKMVTVLLHPVCLHLLFLIIGHTWLHQSKSISYLLALQSKASANQVMCIYYWFTIDPYCYSWWEGRNKGEWICCTLLDSVTLSDSNQQFHYCITICFKSCLLLICTLTNLISFHVY